MFTEEDLATAKDASALAEAGFPFEETLDVTRVLGTRHGALRRGAARAVRPDAIKPGDSEVDLARRLAETAGELMPLSSRMLDHVFLLHMRQLLRNDYIGLAERTSGKVSDTSETTVAFADLVGFTELGETRRRGGAQRPRGPARADGDAWSSRRCAWSSRSATP